MGRPGRAAVAKHVPRLRASHALDLVVANGENAAGGRGVTPDTAREIHRSGVDAITLGNHAWRKKELVRAIDDLPGIVRPANYPDGAPGVGGRCVLAANGLQVGIVNLLGRVFMEPIECPFRTGRAEVERLRAETPVVLVDMHAEATAEKVALGRYLDGMCSAVVGTHTHVQTADERILRGGTAYITDVGMTGPFESVIGVEDGPGIRRFLTGLPEQFVVAETPAVFCAVILDIDERTGNARSIERICRTEPDAGDHAGQDT